ncbi:MAG: gliding motility protein GldN [Bacteroidia bacterium]|nr:gliding motility protein GldN [Bacteroidia bacterium]
MLKRIFYSVFLSTLSVGAFAQAEVAGAEVENAYREEIEEQYNPNSINPIPKYEQHYKLRIWRTIDLQEKQNKGFFSNNGEVTRMIIDAVKSGEITDIYAHDSLTTKLSKEEFTDRLRATASTTYEAWDPGRDWYTDEITAYNGKNYQALRDNRGANPETSPDDWAGTSAGSAVDYLPRDINILRLVEDVIFDRRRSRLYYDVQAVQLIVPGAKTTTGVDEYLGWFKYKDLEKVFRNHPKTAVWFNRQNTAQNKNFADAILLRFVPRT